MIAGMVAAVLLFVGIAGLLLYRAAAYPDPRQVAVIQGSPTWAGAQIVITGNDPNRIYGATIDNTQRYSVPFFLPPGAYAVEVRVGERPVFRDRFELSESETREIYLPTEVPPPLSGLGAATMPATEPSR